MCIIGLWKSRWDPHIYQGEIPRITMGVVDAEPYLTQAGYSTVLAPHARRIWPLIRWTAPFAVVCHIRSECVWLVCDSLDESVRNSIYATEIGIHTAGLPLFLIQMYIEKISIGNYRCFQKITMRFRQKWFIKICRKIAGGSSAHWNRIHG